MKIERVKLNLALVKALARPGGGVEQHPSAIVGELADSLQEAEAEVVPAALASGAETTMAVLCHPRTESES